MKYKLRGKERKKMDIICVFIYYKSVTSGSECHVSWALSCLRCYCYAFQHFSVRDQLERERRCQEPLSPSECHFSYTATKRSDLAVKQQNKIQLPFLSLPKPPGFSLNNVCGHPFRLFAKFPLTTVIS